MNIFKAGWYKNQMEIWRADSEFKELQIKELQNKLVSLMKENEKLAKKVGDPKEVVRKMLDRPIKFVDTSKMSRDAYNIYYREAQEILKNETFLSELNALTVDLVNSSARDTEDFRQVLNRRFTLCGIQLLKERIESLAKVDEPTEPDEEELYEGL